VRYDYVMRVHQFHENGRHEVKQETALPFRFRRDVAEDIEYFHLPCSRSVPGTMRAALAWYVLTPGRLTGGLVRRLLLARAQMSICTWRWSGWTPATCACACRRWTRRRPC